MRFIRWLVCLLPWLGASAVFIWLCLLRVPPTGIRTLSFAFDGRSPWMNPFLPGYRTTPIGLQSEGWTGQRILGEPVYSTLRLPGVYNQLSLGLEFRTQNQPLLEIGVAQEPTREVAMQPLWSEALASGWRRVSWEGKQGYVREGQPDSALADTDMNRLLVWYASSTVPAYMDGEGQERVFPTSLRGSYDIHAVPIQGRVTFRFRVQDMNRQRQKGTLIFTLSKNGDLLSSEALSLAGSRDDRPSELYTKTLSFDGLTGGVYKLSLVADDDIFTREISSPVRHWVIGPRIYFGDQVGYATTTLPGRGWTNAQHLQLDTLHIEGLQTVRLGSVSLAVTEVQRKYALDRSVKEQATTQLFQAPRGDVRVVGDGYFALAPELLFLPAPRRLTDASRPLEEGINAVLTSYIAPRAVKDGWYRSDTTHSLPGRPGILRLTLGAPGIQTREGQVDIRSAQLTYRRPVLSGRSWFQVLWQELASAWRIL